MSRRAHLERLLREHRPEHAREQDFRRQMLDLADAPGHPFARDRYEPGHFTSSGFVVSPDASFVLMILHSKLNRWLQPGGHVEPGDADVLQAARREVAEETGLTDLAAAQDGIFDVDVHSIPAHGDAPAHLHFDVRFLFHASAAPVLPGRGVSDVRWIPSRELGTDAGPALRRVLTKLGVRLPAAAAGYRFSTRKESPWQG